MPMKVLFLNIEETLKLSLVVLSSTQPSGFLRSLWPANIMTKYIAPNIQNIGEMPSLFWSSSMMGVAMAFARPKPMMEMPVARPLLSLNQSISVFTGVR